MTIIVMISVTTIKHNDKCYDNSDHNINDIKIKESILYTV